MLYSISTRQICYNPCFQVVTVDWVLVAHTCIPSFSGIRDQDDNSVKAAQANRW
jgi:hypothetical protein